MHILRVKTRDFDQSQLRILKKHFIPMLPGETPQKKGVLLLFDEPLFLFYDVVFPALKNLEMRALLTVCPRYIEERASLDKQQRLNVPQGLCYQDGFFEEKAPFCTWQELHEMTRSGYVEVASGSYSKMNLTFPFVDLTREVVTAKEVLEERLPQAITSFIFPFGKANAKARAIVSAHYAYSF